ncbi:MAG: sensor signal transduction histidine kinase [Deltaproteobacteria bacterium]|nr:sensor signal transduction histidine kinase [Deltaproteobacteria bacterium]
MKMENSGGDVERRRRQLLESVPVAFLLTDVHSKIIYANRQTEYLFGYNRSELVGERIRRLFLKEDLIYFLTNILYLTLYKEGFEGEALLRQKDGKRIFVHLYTMSFKEEGEVFLAFTIQEIQRLKKLEQESLESEHWAGIGRMVQEIAHQVRNPIASIGGYALRLQKASADSRKRQTYVNQILQETNRLDALVERVEEYVQVPRPVFGREQVEEVVASALEPFSKDARKNGISFSVEAKGLDEDGYLFVDRALVIKAMSHIVQNSVEAILGTSRADNKRSVKVALVDDGEMVRVSVFDKGPGISKRNLQYVFEPFFSTRPDQVGLGLTLVRRIMWEHGGKTRVESHLGKGTTVTLYFPKDRRRKVRRELISPEATGRGD